MEGASRRDRETTSEELYERARKVIPGGVNSPVRAFGSVGGSPRFIRRADGEKLWDEDGREYVDFVGSWGPMILGHNGEQVRESVRGACENGLSFGAATELEVEMAELICRLVPSVEMVRMVNSGTEAVMSAIRTARGYTGRNKLIKFAGCYHGHWDCLLVKAGSGAMTQGVPNSLGVPEGCTQDTLLAEYNSLEDVERLFREYPGEIGALIVEPVAANMGVVPPREGFLSGLRELCTKNGALLIFDEVITGFRLQIDGAQGYYGVTPDLTVFGKIIGGGMPVGAYGGRREIMEMVAPVGGVYQAGTLSGNPVAMAAGLTQLRLLADHPEWYEELNDKSGRFFSAMQDVVREAGLPYVVNHVGSLGSLFFVDGPVWNYEEAGRARVDKYAAYFRKMLEQGIYLAPAQFEAMFLSMAHGEHTLAMTLECMRKALQDKEA